MQIQARAVDTKKHTKGFKVSGKWRTRSETAKLVRQGKIPGVVVRRSNHGEYVAALPDHPRLYTLPTVSHSTIKRPAISGRR